MLLSFFFFNDTATTEIYTLSLHDALPILTSTGKRRRGGMRRRSSVRRCSITASSARATSSVLRSNDDASLRSEEHTSELQSQSNLVCRLLLEKKKKKYRNITYQYPKSSSH